MRNWDGWEGWRGRGSVHWRPFALLVVHIAMTATMFAAILTVGWLIAVFSHYLNGVEKFPSRIYTVAGRFEVGLFYVDCVLSGFVLLISILRFVRELIES